MVRELDPTLELKYNKFHVGLAKDGQPFNSVVFRPPTNALRHLDFDLGLTGFNQHEIDNFLADSDADERANAVPEVPDQPASHWAICGCVENTEYFAEIPRLRTASLGLLDIKSRCC
jgi:hypothetical protein